LKPLLLILALAWLPLGAQARIFPELSPEAVVSLTIGPTPITIEYHRPAVRGRSIWGALVPYGQVWVTGANEATRIRFPDPVKVNGTPVPAGTYALFTIPGQDLWTVILSRRARQSGAWEYQAQEDQLRFEVRPKAVSFQEWLTIEMTPSSRQSAYVDLFWEKIRVSFLVEVNVDALVGTRLKKAMAKAEPGDWKLYSDAAEYLLEKDDDLNQALAWADKAIAMDENPTDLLVKARVLHQLGRLEPARHLLKKAKALGKAQHSGPAVLGPIQAMLDLWKDVPPAPRKRP